LSSHIIYLIFCFVIANISGHLTTNVTVQVLQVAVQNVQRIVQWWTVLCLFTLST